MAKASPALKPGGAFGGKQAAPFGTKKSATPAQAPKSAPQRTSANTPAPGGYAGLPPKAKAPPFTGAKGGITGGLPPGITPVKKPGAQRGG